MDKALIYVYYDSYEYANYYRLAINDNIVCDFVSEERIHDLFEKCEELNVSKVETKWCIVQDEDANSWDYEEEIESNGYKLNPLSVSLSDLTTKMNTLFGGDFVIEPDEDNMKKKIRLIYPVAFTKDSMTCDQNKAINDAENILNNAGMTELAKIIREKYERMNKYE